MFPSATPVPGCAGRNTGHNFCINPEYSNGDQSTKNLQYIENIANQGGKIELCQGHCNKNSDCKRGLVCTESINSGVNTEDGQRVTAKVRGCTGTVNEPGSFCTFPILNESVSNRGVTRRDKGSFLRVENEGYFSVYSQDNNELIWDSTGEMIKPNSIASPSYDARTDISISIARDIVYSGEYSHKSMIMDMPQDSIEDSGLHVDKEIINIYGTTAKSYEFLAPYEVTARSMISFHVTLGEGVKALALCVDDEINSSSRSTEKVTTLCLVGGENPSDFFEKTLTEDMEISSGEMKEVKFELSTLFQSQKKMKYIGIVQVVNDNDVSVTESIISGLDFYESSTRRRLNQNQEDFPVLCPIGELASTSEAGLQHSRFTQNDFCSPAANKLQEIVRNEGDRCTTSLQCRSGLCHQDQCVSRVSSVPVI